MCNCMLPFVCLRLVSGLRKGLILLLGIIYDIFLVTRKILRLIYKSFKEKYIHFRLLKSEIEREIPKESAK